MIRKNPCVKLLIKQFDLIIMAKTRVKGKLKDGETVSGKIDKIDDDYVILENEEETERTQVEVDRNLFKVLEDLEGDIVRVKKVGNDYEVDVYDDFDELKNDEAKANKK